MIHIENPKDYTHTNTHKKNVSTNNIINEFSEVTGYKINIQKSVAFPHQQQTITKRS